MKTPHRPVRNADAKTALNPEKRNSPPCFWPPVWF